MEINNQKPEPARHGEGSLIDIQEIFPTIQGEGPYLGHPSIFVRLAGCNIQCPGCDTDYTSQRRKMHINEICDRILQASNKKMIKLVVITGGEPLRQNIGPLIRAIRRDRFRVQIETNGIICPDAVAEMIIEPTVKLVVSPKTSRIHPFISRHAHAFKYVLNASEIDPEDGLPSTALGHKASPRVARPAPEWLGPIYLNPMDEKSAELNERNMQAVLASCMKFGYIAGIQAHKIWNLP